MRVRFKEACAISALRLHKIQVLLSNWYQRHSLHLMGLFLLAAILLSVLVMPSFRRMGIGYFSDEATLASLRTLLGGTGAALIGATTIAFSLVVFAMQVNVERMPHGLFRQLSSDRRLLGSFLGSFMTAVMVAGTALIPNSSWAIPAIVVTIWGIAVIVLLFLYAYRRALQLINPVEQLSIMSVVVQRELRRWNRLAGTAAILIRDTDPRDLEGNNGEINFNISKARFYQANPHWTKSSEQAIHYAISYAKRFAEQGDYEVVDYAFERIVFINATYCAAKHSTFTGSNPLFEVPDATDSFINTSLEHLRRTMQAALGLGDERLAESTIRSIGGLYGVYLEIEYPGHNRRKHHALLASAYMGSAVESVIPHNMPDVLMQGLRLMGKASTVAIDHTDPVEIISLIQKIAVISYVGVFKPDHQPVTLVAFEQFAEVTFSLLVNGKHDIRYPTQQLCSAVNESTKRFLETPETALSSTHSSTFGPYFSSTSVSGFRMNLTLLVNQLLKAPADNERVLEIIRNIETWADHIHNSHKEILLVAVQKRSSFTFDAINWVTGVSELLNALSEAPACTRHLQDDLRKHAVWLVSTLSWLPDDRDSVTFIENYSFPELLFEAAFDGYQRGCLDFYETCKGLLLGWAKKAGLYNTGWGGLETSVKGLVALAINEETPEAATTLKTKFREMLSSEGAPTAEIRARAAASLESSANHLWRLGAIGSIGSRLARQDHSAVRSLLVEMGEVLATEYPTDQPPTG